MTENKISTFKMQKASPNMRTFFSYILHFLTGLHFWEKLQGRTFYYYWATL